MERRPAEAERPPCRYGAQCYRRQPEHRMQFSHPPEISSLAHNAVPLDFQDADLIAKQAALLAEFEAKRLHSSPAQFQPPIERRNERRPVAQGFVQNGALPRSPQSSLSNGPKLPLMLILGGPPGSGKSTFSDALVRQADVPWTRVCQVSCKIASVVWYSKVVALESDIFQLSENSICSQMVSFWSLQPPQGLEDDCYIRWWYLLTDHHLLRPSCRIRTNPSHKYQCFRRCIYSLQQSISQRFSNAL